jgi:hypothetical protein
MFLQNVGIYRAYCAAAGTKQGILRSTRPATGHTAQHKARNRKYCAVQGSQQEVLCSTRPARGQDLNNLKAHIYVKTSEELYLKRPEES